MNKNTFAIGTRVDCFSFGRTPVSGHVVAYDAHSHRYSVANSFGDVSYWEHANMRLPVTAADIKALADRQSAIIAANRERAARVRAFCLAHYANGVRVS